MEVITNITAAINHIVWGKPMLVLILGTGVFLMLGLGFMPIRKLGTGFALLWKGREAGSEEDGEISPFNALMTALSATIGTGNIAGVATAIFMGGPGALFWMWCTALVGMATKYAEAVLAVKYREVDELDNHVGGPMYYIKNGLGKNWQWLAAAFAIFGGIAGFGIGNMVQSNSVADVMESTFDIPPALSGIVIMTLVGLVLIGGIRRIAHVAGALVPFMGIAYMIAGIAVLAVNAAEIPSAISLVFTRIAGAAVAAAIRFGVARGIFSNEAGLGSAPIAHAAAQTNDPVRQGLIGMLGTFIDTLVVCSVTGLAIITSGVWSSGETGAPLTMLAFETTLPGIGGSIVAVALAVFAFTTILGWSVYGERCVEYLFGVKAIVPFRVLWVAAILVGTLVKLEYVWLLADTLNAMMAIPNLIALLLLSPVVFKLTKDYFKK